MLRPRNDSDLLSPVNSAIQLYTGPAAAAARRGLMWRRIVLRGDSSSKAQIDRDTFEAANQFRLARYLAGGAR